MTPEQERLVQAMMAEQGPQQPENRTGRNLAAAGELALMALPFTRVGRAMFSTLPRALGTSIGAGTAIEGARGNLGISSAEAAEPDEGGSLTPGRIRELQQELKLKGLYSGPVDGVITPGGPTERAIRDLDKRKREDAIRDAELKAKQAESEIERNRAAAEAAKAQAAAAKSAAEREQATAAQKAAEAATRQAEIAAREAAERRKQAETAGKKLDEFKGSWPGRLSQAMLAVGPYAGFGLGYWGGHKLQAGIGRRADAAAQAAASRADAVMNNKTPRGVSGDISRVNRFWSEGGGQEPFNFVPNANPRAVAPYRINPQQTPPNELYNQSRLNRAAEHGVVPIAGLAEHILTEFTMARPARAELEAATEAVNKEPSEANISRLQTALVRAGFGELVSRLGLGAVAGSFGHSMTHGIVGGMPRARPATLDRAESQRARLQNLLAQPLPPRAPAGPPPAPLLALPSPGQAQPLGVPPLATPPKALPKPKKKGRT